MKAALQIALVTETWPPEVNGVAMTISRLVAGLRSQGHQVQIIRPRQREESPTTPDFLVAGLPLPGYAGLQFGLPAGRQLRRLWQAQRPDIVHLVTEGPLGWSALKAAEALDLPLSSSYHTHFDGYSRHYGAALLTPLVRRWLHGFHRRAGVTMAPTETLVKQLRQAGLSGAQVLGRGVDTRLFAPSRRSQALRSQWGAGEHDLVVMNVGRLAPEKNLGLAAAAFDAIQLQQPSARMVWVGDGPARRALERKHPLHQFSGARHGEDLASHYASADLFLFPSLSETYGNVVAEAMASGVAVVAYHEAAAAELIISGEQGLTAPSGNETAFIAAACQLASNAALRELCSGAGRARVETLHWGHIVERFEQHLRLALENMSQTTHGGSVRRRFAG
ncbi:glycosyltransferase family 1 protein [Uliginosibacterium sp. 31-12]|uniref:glycosyltransferase family 4 protein n=1 Tax=Uliginosibacterium sp. 31-12 TaxID=3062781 RepID=UPI0026E2F4C0|nr:glycosyltransferase family 1 protein [Uliginosibacterium sp. 31-12]MDO6386139.1 glycosyltransferase family 1 protein [Uliginosibacterium sp. 31-12]